jgi:glycosyltransferase involved in cell wall biosynthesis
LKTLIFIGPIPPPLGGVAAINQSIQQIAFEGYTNLPFNTSKSKLRENLYAKFPWKNVVSEIKSYRKLKATVKKTTPELANVFVTSSFAIIRDLFILRLLYKKNIPSVIHFHSKTSGEFALQPFRLKIVARFFNKYASKILLLSQDHLNRFQDYFDPSKCEILENFVDYKDFDCTIGGKTSDFLFVGRLTEKKGFFNLLEAIRILKDTEIQLKVNVIGMAESEESELAIRKIVEESGIAVYLEFHGALFGDKKNELFKQSSTLLFPSHFENSPVVLKEGIAAKMALICSDIDANKNVLGKVLNPIYHEVNNPTALSNKMKAIIHDSKMAKEMMENSSKIHQFDVSFAKDKLERIYKEICH